MDTLTTRMSVCQDMARASITSRGGGMKPFESSATSHATSAATFDSPAADTSYVTLADLGLGNDSTQHKASHLEEPLLQDSDSGDEDGALQSGEQAQFFNWDYVGIYLQYVVVGVYYGALTPLLYPVFRNLMGLQSYQVKGGGQVMTMWWGFKVFIGNWSDCRPLFGYRRKSYIIAGWACAALFTVVAIVLGQPTRNSGAWKWFLAFSAINIAYIIADVCADSAVADLAQREPLKQRGKLQSNVYTIRALTMAGVALVIALCFNSEEYGGDFGWGIQLPQFLGLMLAFPILGMYPFFRIKESPTKEIRPYWSQFRSLFQRIKLEAVYRVMVASFLLNFFYFITNAAAYDVEKQWCHVTPLADGIFQQVLAQTVLALGIFITKTYFLNTSWRKLLTVCVVASTLVQYIPAVLVDLNIIRNPYFYLMGPVMSQFISGCFFVVGSYAAVEVAEKGSEGMMYGLITTISNLCIPFVTLFSANLMSFFGLYDNDGNLIDTHEGRIRMLLLDTTVAGLSLCCLPVLYILPRQKKHIQDMIKTGSTSLWPATILVFFLVFCTIWSIAGSLLQIFPSTSCSQAVGGKGC